MCSAYGKWFHSVIERVDKHVEVGIILFSVLFYLIDFCLALYYRHLTGEAEVKD